MDNPPRPIRPRRDTNGRTRDQDRRYRDVDWAQMLLETGIDQWSYEERAGMRDLLIWTDQRREIARDQARTARARRTIVLALIAAAATVVAGFGSFIGNTLAGHSQAVAGCPVGYICTATPLSSPSPTGGH